MYPAVTSGFELSFDSSVKFYIHKHTVAGLYNYLNSLDWAMATWPDKYEKLSVKKNSLLLYKTYNTT